MTSVYRATPNTYIYYCNHYNYYTVIRYFIKCIYLIFIFISWSCCLLNFQMCCDYAQRASNCSLCGILLSLMNAFYAFFREFLRLGNPLNCGAWDKKLLKQYRVHKPSSLSYEAEMRSKEKNECMNTARAVTVLLCHPVNGLCQRYVSCILSLWFLCGPVKGGTLLQASLTVVFGEMPSITIRIKQNILLSLSTALPAERHSTEQGFAGDEFPASLITSEITFLRALTVSSESFLNLLI